MTPMTPMTPMTRMTPMKPLTVDKWWPDSLGDSPDSSGGQNGVRYAYFGSTHRLAVDAGNGQVTVYDTGDHEIHGVQQAQGGDRSGWVFTSQKGEVKLADLSRAQAEATK